MAGPRGKLHQLVLESGLPVPISGKLINTDLLLSSEEGLQVLPTIVPRGLMCHHYRIFELNEV